MECSDAALRDLAVLDVQSAMTRRVRLLTVNSTLHIGGAEQVAAALAQHVDRAHFESLACYLKQPGLIGEQMLRGGVELVPVPGLTKGTDYLSFRRLRRLIVARGIDVIHTHDAHGLVDGSLCRLTLPRLRHVHTFHFGNYPHRGRRDRTIERLLWRVPDVLVAVGHAQAASLQAMYGIPADRLRVVWNGVADPTQGVATRARDEARDASPPVISSVSVLSAQKGLEHLVDAAKLLRDGGDNFRLEIVGDGPLREALEARARGLGLAGTVLFRGWVPQASAQVLPAADIFVQSSRWEAMSVVVLEAMAAGAPVVVTRVGENPHVVDGENNGLLVPPGDADALAGALRRLLRDPGLRTRLGAAARAHYLANFTTRHMIAGYEALYRGHAQPATAPVGGGALP
jgi:glycosyltransferase involved in cell wall biosynthesis